MEIVSIASPDREGAPARATVTVRGQSTVRTEPDVAILWITLSAFEESPGNALGDVAQRAEALGALLDELRVPEADRATAGVSVAEEFDPPTRGNRGLGHRATARIAVHLADPEVIGRAISRASEELQASIDGPHWFISPANPAARHPQGFGRCGQPGHADRCRGVRSPCDDRRYVRSQRRRRRARESAAALSGHAPVAGR
jgi:uncharacterized protein YggE